MLALAVSRGLTAACLLAALAACQAQVGAAAPGQAWTSELPIEDPTQVFQEDVWAMLDPSMISERELIFQQMSTHQLAEAIQRARALLKQLTRMDNAPQLLLFRQTIYMLEIKSMAMNRQYLEALLEGVRFSSFCAGLPQGCPNTQPVEQLVRRLEESLLKLEDQVEILGLSQEELADVSKLKRSRDKALHMLHQRQNGYMGVEHLKYLKGLYDWAEGVYSQMLDYATKVRAAAKAEQREAAKAEQREANRARPSNTWASSFWKSATASCKPPACETKEARKSGAAWTNAFGGFKPSVWTKPSKAAPQEAPQSRPAPAQPSAQPSRPAAQPSRPAARPYEPARQQAYMAPPRPAPSRPAAKPAATSAKSSRKAKKVDPALTEMRNAAESKLSADHPAECIELTRELISKLDEDAENAAGLVDFRQSVVVLKVKAEVKSRQYLLALLDTARFISHCNKLPGGCPAGNTVKLMQDEIEKGIVAAGAVELLGLSAAELRDKPTLKKAQRNARLLLHPDRNRDLDDEQMRYVGGLFDRANQAYANLLQA